MSGSVWVGSGSVRIVAGAGRIGGRLAGGALEAVLPAGLGVVAPRSTRIGTAGVGVVVGVDALRSAGIVRLADVTAGPFTVRRFDLSRDDGDKAYRITSTGESSVARVSRYLASGLPPLLSSLLAGATRGVTGRAADRPIPFTLDAELASENGEPRLVRGSGSVAGIPTGPLAALLAQTIVARL